mgnify:CR=1 FL=1
MSVLLSVEDLHTFIGEFHILQGVSFEALEGEITVLLGRNGAGKTTLMNTIMGFLPARKGRIVFKGKDITNLPAYERARLGIGYIPSARRIFKSLTVEENLKIAFRMKNASFKDRLELVLNIFPDLKPALKRKAGHLSGGEQRMLLISMAIINENALLLVDEPSEGLSPVLVKRLADVILRLREEASVLLVEQNLRLAAKVGDTCYIMDKGKIVHKGAMEEVAKNKELIRRYLGVTV